ncbi:MAG: translation initiation factor IF-6 [Promethearchaeota archaeon]
MGIKKESLFGSPSLGVYLAINNEIILVPKNISEEKLNSIISVFQKDLLAYRVHVNQSALLGSYVVLNSNGILVPSIIFDEEFDDFKKIAKDQNMNIEIIDSKDNALGNLILANNKGAIISKSLSKYVKVIQQILDVDVLVLEFAGNSLPGSAGVANNFGCCVHPLVSDEEVEMISDVLKVPVDVSTINMGNPFISSGAIVNSTGGVFGNNSSGPELMRLTNMLHL